MNQAKYIWLCVLGMSLAGCGGGSSSSDSTSTAEPEPPSEKVTVTIEDTEVTEGNTGTNDLVFNIQVSGHESSITLEYSTRDATATADEDYETTSGTVTFEVGESSKQVVVPVIGDVLYSDDDPTESFSLEIQETERTESLIATGTIINDDMSKSEALDQAISLISEEKDSRINTEYHTYNANLTVDLEADGDLDYVLLFADEIDSNNRLNEATPMTYLVNNEGQGFEVVDTDIRAFYRFFEVVDVNGDGLDDIFLVADHLAREVNGELRRESAPWLLIQSQNGELIDRSDWLEQKFGDWHGLESIDIDSDGDTDFVASALIDGLYFFINDGSGNFTVTQEGIPADFVSENATDGYFPSTTSITAADLNNDNFKDLLRGDSEDNFSSSSGTAPTLDVLINDVPGFSFQRQENVIENVYYTDSQDDDIQVIVSMESIDYNDDACKDAVIYQTDYRNNHTISILESNCVGGGNISYVFHENSSRWFDQIIVEDINADGLEDIYMVQSGLIANAQAPILLNRGSGEFEKVDYSEDFNMSLLGTIYYRSPSRDF